MVIAVGLDSDGHKRVTEGKSFKILGGSKETHEEMTEKTIKMKEKLAKRGKDFSNASFEEFDDAAHSVGLKRQDEVEREQRSN